VSAIWKVLARLVAYPLQHPRRLRAAAASKQARRGHHFSTRQRDDARGAAGHYTAAFDFDRAVRHLGCLFGESRDRGAFLSALREDLQRAAITESSELPDHLAHVLALIARDDYVRAVQLADLVMPAVAQIERALTTRGSPYAHALAAVYAELAVLVERVAGSKTRATYGDPVGRGLQTPARQGNCMRTVDLMLLVVLPYAATLLCVTAAIERYCRHGFSFTSFSSQFLENRLHFWALVPFHAGILIVLLGHIVAFLIPRGVLAWNAVPARLLVLEIVALAGGLLALAGLAAAMFRRATVRVVQQSTTPFDWAVYTLLLAQVVTGVAIAVRYPWGSSWYAAAAVPYLRSLVLLHPDATIVAAMPMLVHWHIVLAWLFVAVFSFSRLVHVLAVPNHYLWRAPQVVRWVRRPAAPAGRKP
jgi:nitrate reductase gamma subunit